MRISKEMRELLRREAAAARPEDTAIGQWQVGSYASWRWIRYDPLDQPSVPRPLSLLPHSVAFPFPGEMPRHARPGCDHLLRHP
jgi:hypothetical protein